jgi:hypothetical protein
VSGEAVKRYETNSHQKAAKKDMSHHFIVPTNENGISLDDRIEENIRRALRPPFQFNDVFLYSHGWWTDATRAMEGYNRFTIGFSSIFRLANNLANAGTLNIGVHWPSTLTENHFSLLNYAEAITFYTMEKRADAIGEHCGKALLRVILDNANGPLRLHLVGHSFGCKVICRALQEIVTEQPTALIPAGIEFDIVLLQAAFDDIKLEERGEYGGVPALAGMRMLITTSDADRALGVLYPKAHGIANLLDHGVGSALGSVGPTEGVIARFGGARRIEIGPDFAPLTNSPLNDRLIVANLTALHNAHPENSDNFSGHHSDIFNDEIYRLMAGFMFP